MKLLFVIAVLLCGVPAASMAQQWHATQSWRIKGPAPDSAFADVRGIAVNTFENVYVLDGKKGAIYRFDSASRLLWKSDIQLARNPRNIADASVAALAGGEVVVVDLIGRHLLILDANGALIRDDVFGASSEAPLQWSTLGSSIVAATRPASNPSSVTVPYTVKFMPIARPSGRDIMGISIPARTSFDRETMTMFVNTFPALLLMETSGSHLFVASNQRYQISVFDTSGAKVATLQRDIARKPVTAIDRMRGTRYVAHMLDSIPLDERGSIKWKATYSDSLPAISGIAAGDSLVLVRSGAGLSIGETGTEAALARWDILDLDNLYRGYVELPFDLQVIASRRGKLYGVESSRGKTAIVMLTLVPPESPHR